MKASFAIVLSLTAVFAASCGKVQEDVAERTYSFSIEAGAPLTKALSLDGNELKASWSTSESVAVMKGETKVGVLHPSRDGASTTLAGTLAGDFAMGDQLTLHFPDADVSYSEQKGTLEDISAGYDYATATVRITSVDGGAISAVDNGTGGAANFVNQQAIVKFILKKGDVPLNVSALTVLVSGSEALVIKPASSLSELYVAIPGFSGGDITLSATADGELYQYKRNGVSFSDGQYYAITVKPSLVANAVDLGLPSGTIWASVNIGATAPEEAGDYIAWGETDGYAAGVAHTFNWENYKYYDTAVTKYCSGDGKMVLDADDDAATSLWGASWCMPSLDQIQELINDEYTEAKWESGKKCFRFTSLSNGNSILLPAAGFRQDNELYNNGDYGYYWSNMTVGTSSSDAHNGRSLGLYSSGIPNYNKYSRYRGQSVRPVMK